ncbi:hypothetical protein Godav_000916, partial [Gossypium davidsonii]|nr:hypothetical protein [Gossypium davidsonii]
IKDIGVGDVISKGVTKKVRSFFETKWRFGIRYPFSSIDTGGRNVSTWFGDLDYFEWLTWVFNEISLFQRRFFGCALWAIWSDKNKRVHERQINSGREISNNIFKYLKELDESELKVPTRSSEIVEWVPPSRALIKINFDRAFDRHRSRSSSRVVARNIVGEVLVARTFLHEDVDSIFVVEALACS